MHATAKTLRRIFGFACLVVFFSLCIVLFSGMKNILKVKEDHDEKYEKISLENNTNLSLIFIGGVPRSGTTLMRTMVESHPDIWCGPETHIIPEVIDKIYMWLQIPGQTDRLREAGVYPQAMDMALSEFILNIIKGRDHHPKYYCNKDPTIFLHMKYLHHLFPKAKFIFMIRDGRASTHSIVVRKCRVSDVDITSYRAVLKFWNLFIKNNNDQCKELGDKICLPVYYEQLVLQPVNNTKRIFKFLDIPWTSEVLHHEKHLNQSKLSKFELSTDQVKKPLYLDALTSWFGHIPPDVERDIDLIAPMLKELGYDSQNPHPDYGKPDDFVLGKMNL